MKDVGLWLNDVILLGTAILIWRYVVATNRLVLTSQQQAQAAQDQTESQSKPAVTAHLQGSTIWLVNIGNGPAVYIELARVEHNAKPDFNLGSIEPGRVFSYIEGRGDMDTRLPSNWLSSPQPSLQCRYRSLSGRTYVSVIDPRGGNIMDARFYEASAPAH